MSPDQSIPAVPNSSIPEPHATQSQPLSPLMQLVAQRRSVRNYGATPAKNEHVRYIETCTQTFMTRMGFGAPRICILPRGQAFDAVQKAATSGLVGKVSPWFMVTKASHIIVCGVIYPSAKPQDIENAIIQAAMTMHVAVMAATECGLGTCWMAGIQHERIEKAYEMPDNAKVLAISPLGFPPETMGLSWDNIAKRLVSSRRKPLQELWMQENWRSQR